MTFVEGTDNAFIQTSEWLKQRPITAKTTISEVGINFRATGILIGNATAL
jgi:hypothetical protein